MGYETTGFGGKDKFTGPDGKEYNLNNPTKERYKHFKGGIYELVCVGKNSETEEEMVVYKSEETGQIWIRPKRMFFEKVKRDGKEINRFEKVS